MDIDSDSYIYRDCHSKVQEPKTFYSFLIETNSIYRHGHGSMAIIVCLVFSIDSNNLHSSLDWEYWSSKLWSIELQYSCNNLMLYSSLHHLSKDQYHSESNTKQ